MNEQKLKAKIQERMGSADLPCNHEDGVCPHGIQCSDCASGHQLTADQSACLDLIREERERIAGEIGQIIATHTDDSDNEPFFADFEKFIAALRGEEVKHE